MKNPEYKRLTTKDLPAYRTLMELFAEEFEDPENYLQNKPSDQYALARLANQDTIFLVASIQGEIVSGLVAYALHKFEQERSELYIYDLATKASFRRQGIATGLIEALKPLARSLGARVIFVQADQGDLPAIKLYESMGEKEDVHHFDIMT